VFRYNTPETEGLMALIRRSVSMMIASTSQPASHGGEPTPWLRQSCQQWPSHFSIMTSRILASIPACVRCCQSAGCDRTEAGWLPRNGRERTRARGRARMFASPRRL
jgi:hypothetical protein